MIRQLKTTQLLPVSIDKAWNFFSRPENLNDITPEDMVFKITSDVPENMYEGLMITYKIAPVLGIPLDWCTEITHIKPHEYFVDEQRVGPYKLWHHEHHFEEVKDGVMMKDILTYDIGMGLLGRITGFFFVHKKVRDIFTYREQKLNEIFSKKSLELNV